MKYTFVFISGGFVILGLIFSLIKLLFGWEQREIYCPDPLNDSEMIRREKRISFLELQKRVYNFRTLTTISYYLSVIFGCAELAVIFIAIEKA